MDILKFLSERKIYQCDLTEYINRPGHNIRPVLIREVNRNDKTLKIYNIQSLYDSKGNRKDNEMCDLIINDWEEAGLDHESFVTVLPSLEITYSQVIKFIGFMSEKDYDRTILKAARAANYDKFYIPESFLNWCKEKRVTNTDPKDGVNLLDNKVQSSESIERLKKMNHVDAAFTVMSICENSTKIHSYKMVWIRWKLKPSLDSGHLLCMFTRKTKSNIYNYVFVWTGNYKKSSIVGPLESEEEVLKIAASKILGNGYLGSVKEYYEFKEKDYNLMRYYLEYDITIQRDFLERIINKDTKFERIPR